MVKEIVAAKINSVITTNRAHIAAALEMNMAVEFLERKHMQFMDQCDLGPVWHQLAIAPTIFCIDDKGEPIKP